MTPSDMGIVAEVFGFLLLLFTASRLANGNVLTLGKKENAFEKFSKKLIPDKHVYIWFKIGIGMVIIGLLMQISFLNPE